jgi:serine phosphatase RsbU (regulator of sigma subunit)
MIDYFLPSALHLAPLLPVAPAFTAAFAGPRPTAVVCVLTVLAQITAGAERNALGTEQVLTEIIALSLMAPLFVLFCHVRETKQRQLTEERQVSETAQRAVMRPLPHRAGPLDIATEYRPARPGSRIGGDLFALARTAHSTRLLIGDVRGKGLDSLNDLSLMTGAFRAAAHRQAPLPELAAYLEGSVHWGLAELSDVESDVGERFVTAAVADIPDDEPVIHLVSCGHPPPILLHGATATPLSVREPAPPLGFGALVDIAYWAETFPFPEGGHLLLYTDGVSEARAPDGTFYPLTERAAGLAAPTARPPVGARALLDELTADLVAYTGGPLDDDMAMIAVRRGERGEAGEPDGPVRRTGSD